MTVSIEWIKNKAPHFANEADMRALCRRGHYPDDLARINPESLLFLERLRVLAGVPLVILCGYEDRSGAHGAGDGIDFCPLVKTPAGSDRDAGRQIQLMRSCREALRIWYLADTLRPWGLGIYPQGRSHDLPYFHIDYWAGRDRPGGPGGRHARWFAWPDLAAPTGVGAVLPSGSTATPSPDGGGAGVLRRTGRLVYKGVDLPDLLRTMATTIETGHHVLRKRKGLVK